MNVLIICHCLGEERGYDMKVYASGELKTLQVDSLDISCETKKTTATNYGKKIIGKIGKNRPNGFYDAMYVLHCPLWKDFSEYLWNYYKGKIPKLSKTDEIINIIFDDEKFKKLKRHGMIIIPFFVMKKPKKLQNRFYKLKEYINLLEHLKLQENYDKVQDYYSMFTTMYSEYIKKYGYDCELFYTKQLPVEIEKTGHPFSDFFLVLRKK